jgi:DegV family protein with EDD domain
MTSKKIRIVTDSTCDIPAELIKQYGIGVVPCFVNYGGQSYADNGVDFIRENYYAQMPDIRPPATTSAPPPGLAEEVIKATFEGADHLMIICVPAKLSGVFNTLRLGAKDLPPECVTMVDSGTVAMALGWQVIIAAETAEATGDVNAVLNAVQRVREHQNLYAALATMEYLRRSGRVGWAAANIGQLLQIKPIIEVEEGNVHSIAKVRTFTRAVDELYNLTDKEAPLDRLAVLHTNNLEGAHEFHQRLGDIAPPDTLFVNLNPSVGTHIGPGALGVATVSKSWRT